MLRHLPADCEDATAGVWGYFRVKRRCADPEAWPVRPHRRPRRHHALTAPAAAAVGHVTHRREEALVPTKNRSGTPQPRGSPHRLADRRSRKNGASSDRHRPRCNLVRGFPHVRRGHAGMSWDLGRRGGGAEGGFPAAAANQATSSITVRLRSGGMVVAPSLDALRGSVLSGIRGMDGCAALASAQHWRGCDACDHRPTPLPSPA